MNCSPPSTHALARWGWVLVVLAGCASPTPTFSPPTATTEPTPAAPLVDFFSTPGRFEVWIPVAQSLHIDLVQRTLVGVSIDCHSITAPDNGAIWLVRYCDYPQAVLARFRPQELLDQERDDALEEAVAALLHEERISFHSYPGRSLVARSFMGGSHEGIYKARLYLAGHRLYQVAVSVVKEDWCHCMSRMDAFLESFYIEDN